MQSEGSVLAPSDVAALRGIDRFFVLSVSRRPVSLHEAGHAVAMCVLGIPFTAVSAVMSDDAFGRVSHVDEVPDSEAYVVALYAGVEATRRWYSDAAAADVGGERDFQLARAVVVRLAGAESERRLNSRLRKLRLQARALVNDPGASRAIELVATKLAKGQKLSRKTICRLVHETAGKD